MIDVASLKQSVDLLVVIERDTTIRKVASTRGGEYAGPCPFCGGTDRLRVQPDRGLWWCRQCSPDEHWQDVIAYVMQRDRVDFAEAAQWLKGGSLATTFTPKGSTSKPSKSISDDWRKAADEVVRLCELALWDAPGRSALDWLHRRGLSDDTLKTWRAGFNPASRKIAGLWVESGVTLPYFAGGNLYAVNGRRPDRYLAANPDADKYKLIGGSTRVLFGADHITGKPDIFITEGEFDLMLVWQSARDWVDVLTMGAATTMPGGLWLAYLAAGQRFYIATDYDDAGNEAARKWLDLVGGRGIRVDLPSGKDITEYWQAGGDIRRWVQSLIGHEAESPARRDLIEVEAELVALFDEWDRADDQGSPRWAQRWAALAIEAGLPCYPDGVHDAGADGWHTWANEAAQ